MMTTQNTRTAETHTGSVWLLACSIMATKAKGLKVAGRVPKGLLTEEPCSSQATSHELRLPQLACPAGADPTSESQPVAPYFCLIAFHSSARVALGESLGSAASARNLRGGSQLRASAGRQYPPANDLGRGKHAPTSYVPSSHTAAGLSYENDASVEDLVFQGVPGGQAETSRRPVRNHSLPSRSRGHLASPGPATRASVTPRPRV